jgi:hypothetical protein
MKFSFEVGEKEKHQVRFQRNWPGGDILIFVDDLQVAYRDGRAYRSSFDNPASEPIGFTVGDHEKHNVRIVPVPQGFWEPCKYRILVDGNYQTERYGYWVFSGIRGSFSGKSRQLKNK